VVPSNIVSDKAASPSMGRGQSLLLSFCIMMCVCDSFVFIAK